VFVGIGAERSRRDVHAVEVNTVVSIETARMVLSMVTIFPPTAEPDDASGTVGVLLPPLKKRKYPATNMAAPRIERRTLFFLRASININ
jgi:hypothetical protein